MYIVQDSGNFHLFTENGTAPITSTAQLVALRKVITSDPNSGTSVTATERQLVADKIAEARGQQPVTIEVSAEAIATSLKPKLNIPTAAECGAAARFAIIKP